MYINCVHGNVRLTSLLQYYRFANLLQYLSIRAKLVSIYRYDVLHRPKQNQDQWDLGVKSSPSTWVSNCLINKLRMLFASIANVISIYCMLENCHEIARWAQNCVEKNHRPGYHGSMPSEPSTLDLQVGFHPRGNAGILWDHQHGAFLLFE